MLAGKISRLKYFPNCFWDSVHTTATLPTKFLYVTWFLYTKSMAIIFGVANGAGIIQTLWAEICDLSYQCKTSHEYLLNQPKQLQRHSSRSALMFSLFPIG
jgi:hypothetical protein